ncbi:Matrix metalloproteinase-14-like Protein [Tribolium castaneum]|uniref:Matrix metalloproteinase-14-like Protein n=1 Tax=Tribolium castaneum TaxID=7070 RepID=D7EK30_TRICA|nr:Matrix metalloproteinase-14-like Protein [Tribolium castaneum]
MLSRILKMKTAVVSTLAIIGHENLNSLIGHEWNVVSMVMEILSLFNDVKIEISYKTNVSISKKNIFVQSLKRHVFGYLNNEDLQPEILKMLQIFVKELSNRFHNDENNELIAEATILDTRFKKLGFAQMSKFEAALLYVRNDTIFDGPGNVLAHADFPNDINVTEIHIDNAESWSYSTTVDASYSDSPSLLNVIIHELGHTLGLEHSSVNTSIMYSFYSNSRSKLDQDDIWAIQNLYGIKSKQKPTFNVSTTTTTTTTTQKSLLTTSTPKNVTVLPKDNNNKFPDLCSLQTIDKFLIVKTHLYIFYKKWVWLIEIGKNSYPKPYLITVWLTFLPKDFEEITAIYHKPSTDDIVIIVKDEVYIFSLSTFKLKTNYPKSISEEFKISSPISAAITTYSGGIYLFLRDNTYITLSSCISGYNVPGLTNELFEGVPNKITGAFRYLNGKLYFLMK